MRLWIGILAFTTACHGCHRDPPAPQVGRMAGHDAWQVQMDPGVIPSATVVGRHVIVGDGFNSTSLVAFDGATGRSEWTTPLGDNGAGPAVAVDDAVAFTTESCTLYVADARTGAIRWSKWLGDPLVSHPTAAAHVVYLVAPETPASQSHALFAFDASDGHERWHVSTGADAIGSPVVAGDRVYVATQDGLVHRYTTEGKEAWTVAAGAMSAPVVDGAGVFVVARERAGESAGEGLRRLQDEGSSASISELWHPRRVEPVASSGDEINGMRFGAALRHLGTLDSQALWSWQGGRPFVSGGRVYALVGDDVAAFDTSSGKELWSAHLASTEKPVAAPPVESGGRVFIATQGVLEVRDAATGAVRESIPIGAPVTFPPVVAGDRLIVSTTDGRVLSIRVGG